MSGRDRPAWCRGAWFAAVLLLAGGKAAAAGALAAAEGEVPPAAPGAATPAAGAYEPAPEDGGATQGEPQHATGAEDGGAPEGEAAEQSPRSLAGRIWNSIFFKLRYRHLYRDDYDLDARRDDGDNFDWFKLSLGSAAEIRPWLRFRAEGRLTRSWGNNVRSERQQDHFDLWEGWIEVGSLEEYGVAVRGWRQVLRFGDEKLVGPLEWVNNARTFDGLRLRGKHGELTLDAFWVRQVRAEDPDDRNFNRPDGTDFLGLYGSVPLSEAFTLEPFYFVRYDDNDRVVGERGERGVLHLHSPGVRAHWFDKATRLGATAYAVVQYGSYGPDTIFAWAGSLRLEAQPAPAESRYVPTLAFEFNYGSGDRRPTDGRRNTFDNLYPTNHDFYGEMDLASWQNTISTGGMLQWRLASVNLQWDTWKSEFRFDAGMAVWSFWLAQRRDAWYDAANTVLARDPSGRSGRHVGTEFDLWFTFGPFRIVYGHFEPGVFARNTRGDDAADLVYLEIDTFRW